MPDLSRDVRLTGNEAALLHIMHTHPRATRSGDFLLGLVTAAPYGLDTSVEGVHITMASLVRKAIAERQVLRNHRTYTLSPYGCAVAASHPKLAKYRAAA